MYFFGFSLLICQTNAKRDLWWEEMNLRSTLHLFRSISMNKWLTFYALNTTHEKPSQFLLLMKRIRWGIRLNQKSKIKDENVHIFLTASGEGGQTKRSAWPLFHSFFCWRLPLVIVKKPIWIGFSIWTSSDTIFYLN